VVSAARPYGRNLGFLDRRERGIQEKHVRISGVLDKVQTGYHTNKSQKRYNLGECVQYDNVDYDDYYDYSASSATFNKPKL
jgi:hypothetical protein